jgi:antitoxin component YwqK of YwqJK toxin-antitoxin module
VPRVDMNELEPDETGSWMLHDGILFSGVGYENWPDGKLKSETPYRDGYRHGVDREWYPSGQLKSEQHFENGGAHGTSRQWYESGALKSDETYERTILVSRREYDVNGQLTEDFKLTADHPNYRLLQLRRK